MRPADSAEMRIPMKQIADDIRQNSFRQVYLLYGEERYLRRQYREKLRAALCAGDDTMNVHFYEGKDTPVEEIIDLAETLPFLAERRVIFITDSGLLKSGGEKLAEYLSAPCETAFFIFSESEVDKRCKLYKTLQSKGCAVEFSAQDEGTLTRWIASTLAKEGKNVTESTVQLILSKTGSGMDNIRMELEKLICYCMDRDTVTVEDVEAVCTTRVSNHIFDMISAIADRKQQKALELYYDLLALKEPPMRILFLLARQCNMLLQTKELKARGHDNRSIGAKTGVPPFVVQKYAAQAAHFKTSTLRDALQQCVEAEEAVKSGRMNDRMSVEMLILSVLP